MAAYLLVLATIVSAILSGMTVFAYSGVIDTQIGIQALQWLYGKFFDISVPVSYLLTGSGPSIGLVGFLLMWMLPVTAVLILSIARRTRPLAGAVLLVSSPLTGYIIILVCGLSSIIKPSSMFVVPYLVAAVAVALCRWFKVAAFRGRTWLSLIAFVVLTLIMAVTVSVLTALSLGGRTEVDEKHRLVDANAYDIRVVDGRDLIWTDRESIWRIQDIYGTPSKPAKLTDLHMSERITGSRDGGFYVMASSQGITRFDRNCNIVSRMKNESDDDLRHVIGVIECPGSDNVISVVEWQPKLYILDSSTWKKVKEVIGWSNGYWSWPYMTFDRQRGVIYLSTVFSDGALYSIDPKTFAVTRRLTGLHSYECVMDSTEPLLWCVRSMAGEVVAVDIEKYQIRKRFHVAPLLRDIAMDAATHSIYTLSSYGDVSRVDAQTGLVTTVGSCGMVSRNLFIDLENRTLWATSTRGIFRFPLDEKQVQK